MLKVWRGRSSSSRARGATRAVAPLARAFVRSRARVDRWRGRGGLLLLGRLARAFLNLRRGRVSANALRPNALDGVPLLSKAFGVKSSSNQRPTNGTPDDRIRDDGRRRGGRAHLAHRPSPPRDPWCWFLQGFLLARKAMDGSIGWRFGLGRFSHPPIPPTRAWVAQARDGHTGMRQKSSWQAGRRYGRPNNDSVRRTNKPAPRLGWTGGMAGAA